MYRTACSPCSSGEQALFCRPCRIFRLPPGVGCGSIAAMKTCLGAFLLLLTLCAVTGTVVYHACANSDLRFEERDTNSQYINTRRSYRPRKKPRQQTPPPAPVKPQEHQEDEIAEEV